MIPIEPQCRARSLWSVLILSKCPYNQVTAWESGWLQGPERKVRAADIYCVNTVDVCLPLSGRREEIEDMNYSCCSWGEWGFRDLPHVQLPKSWAPSSFLPKKKKKKKKKEKKKKIQKKQECGESGVLQQGMEQRKQDGGQNGGRKGTQRQHFIITACLTQSPVFLVILCLPGLGLRRQWWDKARCPRASSRACPVRMTAFCFS